MEPIIKLNNVNFTYNKGKDNEFQALINVNIEIFPEEFVIFFGPSGCGKSTLLNVIAGLEKPDTGEVSVLGHDLIKMTSKQFAMYHRSEVGMVYQAYNLITSLTVLDNVALPQMFIDISKRKREKWGLSLLERFGILKQARRIPTELSGGQQQRIGIARAIVNNPKVILADEPVGNLDSNSAKNVLEILMELNEKEKKSLIMVTHNPENLYLADRIVYLKDGVIIKEEINHEKKKPNEKKELKPKSPSATISDLMRAYHGLSPEQINILIMPYKAKIFAHHFITNRSMEETKIFEDVIQRRLIGTISHNEFYDILNRSSMESGVGYDKRTAKKIVDRVDDVIGVAYYLYQEGHQGTNDKGEHEKITTAEKTEKVLKHLFDTCYAEHYQNLSEEQVDLLREAITERVASHTDKMEFFNFLDKPLKEGGVGLNSKTAKSMTEEIELILVLGFGIIQRREMIDSGEDTKEEVVVKKEKKVEQNVGGGNINRLKADLAQRMNAESIPKIVPDRETLISGVEKTEENKEDPEQKIEEDNTGVKEIKDLKDEAEANDYLKSVYKQVLDEKEDADKHDDVKDKKDVSSKSISELDKPEKIEDMDIG